MIVRCDYSRRRFVTWAAALGGGLAAAAPAHALSRTEGERSRTRVHYIAAETVTWNYAPQGRNLVAARSFNSSERVVACTGDNRLGPVFEKSRYREYTDDTFTKPADRGHAPYTGLLGPVIRAQVGDTITVVFRNNTPFPASMHPHGVFYSKGDEGVEAPGGDPGANGVVEPGGTHRYTWYVPERAGPGPDDPSSIGWVYHDHSVTMGVPGVHAGLVGPLVVSRRGEAAPDGSPYDVNREVFSLFQEFDENDSHYLRRNIDRFGGNRRIDEASREFQRSNRKPSINGYLFGNGPRGVSDTSPSVILEKGKKTRWYVMALGGTRDTHTPHWHGNTVTIRGHRADVVSVLPATVVTADMRPDNSGNWLFHCHVDEHMLSGMSTLYRVR
ncbi:multicopper oxidase domain-containing protein [Streptomyces sp. ET3-23]|uniref:multicopper oxidase domain-containing protein n=1 Tax=Streptomyces sp. ET3-23 TaxID=2885643 RepID=UPI001D1037E7|nr:multicopper oxidase domain-containing protein [Streptomyces sp. ET3-23]MCC2275243.1 multicopper oxidase domain-containing protein [Streptomyces sp. ET3-23]